MAVKSIRNSKRNTPGSALAHPAALLLERQEFLDPFAVGAWTPPVDICQTAKRILVRMEIPGIELADLTVSYQGENLRIVGVKREPAQSRKLLCYYCLERRYGKFDRQIALKGVVNPRQSRAYLEKGVLTVEIPKLKDRRGDKVEIQVARK